MKKTLIMTPGPTYVSEEVRRALSREITNPDLDPDFYEFYKNTCDKLKILLETKNDVLILSGEGILGLEAACASLIEPGDRVLCIDNGIFGKGFGDFVSMYGGVPVYYTGDYRKEIDVDNLRAFLQDDNNFKFATIIHCETPSGITNPVDKICPLLKEYGILTIVDSVSAIGGEPLAVDEWKVDIALGGSQKCLSAPPGLTFLSISQDAWKVMLNRRDPIIGYYCNLTIWRDWYSKKWFPYTQPISDIFALDAALDLLLKDKNRYDRHRKIGSAVRCALKGGGLELYPLEGHSNTVTTVLIPEDLDFSKIFDDMINIHGIMIAGAFGFLKDKVFRIGHMGENCYEEKLYSTLKALDNVLKSNGFKTKKPLHKEFVEAME